MKKKTKKMTKKTTQKVANKVSKKVAKKKAAKKKVMNKKVTKKLAKKAVKKAAKKIMKKTAAPALPAVGAPAPAFTLPDHDGKLVSLEDFKGHNVLVYFYPRAMTPGCTVQACGLRDSKEDLSMDDVVVLGISPDKPATLKKFIEKDGLNFRLLSDVDNTVAKAYGSFGPKSFMGRNYDGILRQSFLIDRHGNLAHVISKVNTVTHAQEVVDYFAQHS